MAPLLRPTLFAMAICAFITVETQAAVTPQRIYVDKDVETPGDGSSWAKAYDSLYLALYYVNQDTSQVHDIWVAEGTYLAMTPKGEPSPFNIADNKIYGGFVGNETSLSQRNGITNATFLSGDLMQNDSKGIYTDNASVIVLISGTESLLSDLTICNARGRGDYPSTAIRSNFAMFTMTRCNVVNNRILDGNTPAGPVGGGQGGAMRINYGSAIINECTFSNNSTGTSAATALNPGQGGSGGAVSIIGADAYFTQCSFQNNRAASGADSTGFGGGGSGGTGGAVDSSLAFCTFTDCEFKYNRAGDGGDSIGGPGGQAGRGGAIHSIHGATYIRNCRFIENRSGSGGQGVSEQAVGEPGGAVFAFSQENTIVLENSLFANNMTGGGKSSGHGGGAYVDGNANVTNCKFVQNRVGPWTESAGSGGGLYLSNDSTVVFCTFVDNSNAMGSYSGLYSWKPSTLLNCIVWNSPMEGKLSPTYSCIKGWAAGGTGNFSSNPKFVDNKDYRLATGSPCIDTGKAVLAFANDYDMDARGYDGDGKTGTGDGSETDIGADEALIAALSISATDASASESGDKAVIRINRSNPALNMIPINLTWTGSAAYGLDYTAPGSPVILHAGANVLDLQITPVEDAEAEGLEEIFCSIAEGATYRIGSPLKAGANLNDNEPQGSLKLNLYPPAAVAAGAKWRPAGRSGWFDSGQVVNKIKTGPCAIEFMPVKGFTVPTKAVNITANTQANANASYARSAVDPRLWEMLQ